MSTPTRASPLPRARVQTFLSATQLLEAAVAIRAVSRSVDADDPRIPEWEHQLRVIQRLLRDLRMAQPRAAFGSRVSLTADIKEEEHNPEPVPTIMGDDPVFGEFHPGG